MRLFIFLVIFPAFLTAQSAFLKDPDIVWAVEIEQDWVIDVLSLEAEGDSGITTMQWHQCLMCYTLITTCAFANRCSIGGRSDKGGF